MTYAANTAVSVDKSRAEIELTLRRYGADTFHSGWDPTNAFVAFRMRDRFVRLSLPLPAKDEKRFREKPVANSFYRVRVLSKQQSLEAYEQELRTRFRALLLVVKAKLESVEAGIETFEQAFLAHIVLPDNTLVGERVAVLVADAYRTGSMNNLLPAPGSSSVDADD